MIVVHQLFAAILAASLVWTSSAGAVQAHTHEIDGDHGSAIHAVALHADAGHHAAAGEHDHDRHNAAIDDDADSTQPDHEQHEKGVFHAHSLCLVALEASYPLLSCVLAVHSVEPSTLVVRFHTRSVTPADRPPRTFL